MRFCIHCGKEIPDDSNFCIHCGLTQDRRPVQPVVTSAPSTKDSVKSFVGVLGTLLSLAMLAFAVITLADLYLGIPTVIDVWEKPFTVYIILNGVVELFKINNSLLIFYILFIVAITISFAILILRSKATLVNELQMKPVKEHSPLYTVCTLIMVSILITIIFQIVIPALFGMTSNSMDVSTLDRWAILYSAAEAPVWEELISRVLLLGIPLMIADFALSKTTDYQRKPLKRYVLGGGFEFGTKEIVFLLISSMLFGYAHLGSWDAFKIIPATVAGLMMGYLFLKFGLYASIAFHAINNLIGFAAIILNNQLLILILSFVLLAIYIFSIAYLANYTLKLSKWIAKKLPSKKEQTVMAASAVEETDQEADDKHLPPETPQTIGFKCKNCGNDSAVFENGELICTKCRFKN